MRKYQSQNDPQRAGSFVPAVRQSAKEEKKKGKSERLYCIDAAQFDWIVQSFCRRRPDGFGWPKDVATEALDACLCQVDKLLSQTARDRVFAEDIWGLMKCFILDDERAGKFRSEAEDPAWSLAAYMAISLGHELEGEQGVGIITKCGSYRRVGLTDAEAEAEKVREVAFKRSARIPVSLSSYGNGGDFDDDASCSPLPGLPNADSIDDLLLLDEARRDARDRSAEFWRLLPILRARFKGLGAGEAWEARDEIRRQRNPNRLFVTTDPAAVELYGSSGRGGKLRARAVHAGLAAWRKLRGQPFCFEHERVLAGMARRWGANPIGNRRDFLSGTAKKLRVACSQDPAKCPRCNGPMSD
ncbi:MAG: hypothetical protein L0H29_07855, partial [Sinobacteraceae bacterium]|nr:hypothetical protein [Nevskiaceae bacterium]